MKPFYYIGKNYASFYLYFVKDMNCFLKNKFLAKNYDNALIISY